MKNRKIKIELHFANNGRVYLDFWNPDGGDVCTEIIDGKLFLSCWDENGDPLPDKEIMLAEF